jgi:hypothetical protein
MRRIDWRVVVWLLVLSAIFWGGLLLERGCEGPRPLQLTRPVEEEPIR